MEIGAAKAWPSVQSNIEAAFLEVMRSAVPLQNCWSSGIYKDEDERHIYKRQHDLSYEDELPAGRDDVLNLANRLRALCKKTQSEADRLPAPARSFLQLLASAYYNVHGRYYLLKEPSNENREYWLGVLQRARSRDDVEVRRACEVALKGFPEKISDFLIEPLYVLVKADGTRQRILRIHPVHGRTTPKLPLASNSYSQPCKFREWLYNNCSAAGWRTGERPLQSLAFDINRATGFKEVNEVPLWGYHESSRMWFFGDVVYSPDGVPLKPDRQGIFHYDGKMYCPSEKDQEGEFFRQKAPLLHPEQAFSDAQLRELYQHYTRYLYEVIGGYAGFLAVGTILSYAAAPEIYDRHGGFGSLWIHGAPKQGKTSVSRWLMGIYGFNVDAGTSIQKMSAPGLAILLQQYGNLPVWVEEFQHPPEKWQVENLKAMYDRQPGSKKNYAELQRVVRTSGIVTGVSTAENEQLRSRFCHIQVAIENRFSKTKGLPDRFDWFKDNFDKLYTIGRYLMQHRVAFAKLVMEQLKLWVESKALSNCDPRARIVHGASYAAFAAMSAMLESHSADEMVAFKEFLLGYVEKAVEETKSRSALIQFFTDIISALKYGEFGDSPQERGQFFRIDPWHGAPSPVGSPRQRELEAQYGRPWKSYILSITLSSVVDRVMAYKRRAGQVMDLNVSDLKAQLLTQPFYMAVPAKNKDRRQKMRFSCSRGPQECVRIILDKFPGMGYVNVSDQEFEDSIARADGNIVPSSDWEDPRQGDLFVFVDFLRNESTE